MNRVNFDRISKVLTEGWSFFLKHEGDGWQAMFLHRNSGERFESRVLFSANEAVTELVRHMEWKGPGSFQP